MGCRVAVKDVSHCLLESIDLILIMVFLFLLSFLFGPCLFMCRYVSVCACGCLRFKASCGIALQSAWQGKCQRLGLCLSLMSSVRKCRRAEIFCGRPWICPPLVCGTMHLPLRLRSKPPMGRHRILMGVCASCIGLLVVHPWCSRVIKDQKHLWCHQSCLCILRGCGATLCLQRIPVGRGLGLLFVRLRPQRLVSMMGLPEHCLQPNGVGVVFGSVARLSVLGSESRDMRFWGAASISRATLHPVLLPWQCRLVVRRICLAVSFDGLQLMCSYMLAISASSHLLPCVVCLAQVVSQCGHDGRGVV